MNDAEQSIWHSLGMA